jgi:acyl-CoA synthetase (AMP-forming)/AMP-acid ligase II
MICIGKIQSLGSLLVNIFRSNELSENLGCIFQRHLGKSRVAFIDTSTDNVYTYDDLDDMCNAVVRGLRSYGLKVGDRVGIESLNRIEFMAVIYGAMRAGVVPVLINIKLEPSMIEYIKRDADCKLIFDDDFFKYEWGDFITASGSSEPIIPDLSTIAMQPYTAGSTGKPKGVLLNHHGQLWWTKAQQWSKPEHTYLVASPMYHIQPHNVINPVLLSGCRTVLMPRFDTKEYISAIEQYRPDVLTGVPAMFHMILEEKLPNVDCVKELHMGGDIASPFLLGQLKHKFNDPVINIRFGMTESGPRVFGDHPTKPTPLGSVGYPLPSSEVRLMSDGIETDNGEMWVRNPGVLMRYHNLPELTTEKKTEDGWFKTGDVLSRDDDGFYWYINRIDDMFNSGGEKIYPTVVKTLLEKHPRVSSSSVVPVPHTIKGQVPVAFVTSIGHVTEEELRKFCIENGPAYAHPRKVFFMDEFPLSNTNKVDVTALKQIASEKIGGSL